MKILSLDENKEDDQSPSTPFPDTLNNHQTGENPSDSSTGILKKQLPKKKYVQLKEIWDAKNNFWFFGYFIKGPNADRKAKYCYWISFSLIQVLYFSMIAPYLLLKVSYLLFTFNLVILLATLIFSAITSYKDPGIIPKYPILKAINDGFIPEKFKKPSSDQEERKF